MENTRNGGFPLLGILGVIFVTLKLTGSITWPWIWVLAPFWGPLVLALVLFAFFGLVVGAVAVAKSKSDKSSSLRSVGK